MLLGASFLVRVKIGTRTICTQKCNGCFPLNTYYYFFSSFSQRKKRQIKVCVGKFCFEMDNFIFILASDFFIRLFTLLFYDRKCDVWSVLHRVLAALLLVPDFKSNHYILSIQNAVPVSHNFKKQILFTHVIL